MTTNSTDLAIISAITAIESLLEKHPGKMGTIAITAVANEGAQLSRHASKKTHEAFNSLFEDSKDAADIISQGISPQEVCIIVILAAVRRLVNAQNLPEFATAINYSVEAIANVRSNYLSAS